MEEKLLEVLSRELENSPNGFLWVVDPLDLLSPLSNSLPYLHFYDNEIDFRLFYEPLRERMERGEKVKAIVVSREEDVIPPDVRRYAGEILHLKPSYFFPSLHPVINELITKGRLLAQFLPYYDGKERNRRETINFFLQTILEVPIVSQPSEEQALSIAIAFHQRGEGIPKEFLLNFLRPLENLGYKAEDLLKKEGLLSLLREILLKFLEEGKPSSLLRNIPQNLLEEVGREVDWRGKAEAIPLDDLLPLTSYSLPNAFWEAQEERIVEGIYRGDGTALKVAKRIWERKKSPRLRDVLDIWEFMESEKGKEPPKKAEGWLNLRKRIANLEVKWGEASSDTPLRQEWRALKRKLNEHFVNFIKENYPLWIKGKPRPLLSCDILNELLRRLGKGEIFLLILDGMSYEHWAVIREKLQNFLLPHHTLQEEAYFAILPTTTPYSRNSLLSSLLPREIAKRYGERYLEANRYEEQMLSEWAKGQGIKIRYCRDREKMEEIAKKEARLKVFILNFIDEITHQTGKMAESEEEFRAFVRTKFQFSHLDPLLSAVKSKRAHLVITSDHGNIWVREGKRLEGLEEVEEKSTRFQKFSSPPHRKVEGVVYIREDEANTWGLPSFSYALAGGEFKFDKNPARSINMAVHGGISLEEMVVPLAIFSPKEE